MSQIIRIEDSVTSLSWIPREAIEGLPKIPFEVNATRYDEPPPDRLTEGDLETLLDAGRFRFVNRLRAWAEIEDGKIVRYGHEGQSLIGKTRVKLAASWSRFPPSRSRSCVLSRSPPKPRSDSSRLRAGEPGFPPRGR